MKINGVQAVMVLMVCSLILGKKKKCQSKTWHEVIIDREEAIKKAISEIKDNEIVLIAGKGHEEYQDIEGTKFPFSDFDLVKKYKK